MKNMIKIFGTVLILSLFLILSIPTNSLAASSGSTTSVSGVTTPGAEVSIRENVNYNKVTGYANGAGYYYITIPNQFVNADPGQDISVSFKVEKNGFKREYLDTTIDWKMDNTGIDFDLTTGQNQNTPPEVQGYWDNGERGVNPQEISFDDDTTTVDVEFKIKYDDPDLEWWKEGIDYSYIYIDADKYALTGNVWEPKASFTISIDKDTFDEGTHSYKFRITDDEGGGTFWPASGSATFTIDNNEDIGASTAPVAPLTTTPLINYFDQLPYTMQTILSNAVGTATSSSSKIISQTQSATQKSEETAKAANTNQENTEETAQSETAQDEGSSTDENITGTITVKIHNFPENQQNMVTITAIMNETFPQPPFDIPFVEDNGDYLTFKKDGVFIFEPPYETRYIIYFIINEIGYQRKETILTYDEPEVEVNFNFSEPLHSLPDFQMCDFNVIKSEYEGVRSITVNWTFGNFNGFFPEDRIYVKVEFPDYLNPKGKTYGSSYVPDTYNISQGCTEFDIYNEEWFPETGKAPNYYEWPWEDGDTVRLKLTVDMYIGGFGYYPETDETNNELITYVTIDNFEIDEETASQSTAPSQSGSGVTTNPSSSSSSSSSESSSSDTSSGTSGTSSSETSGTSSSGASSTSSSSSSSSSSTSSTPAISPSSGIGSSGL